MRFHLFTALLFAAAPQAFADAITLSENCPPSFELMEDGTCQLRTLYDLYDSPPQHGGVQAQLPALKAKFTPKQIDLGRVLFFDPILSAAKDMSCASCHQPDKGFADGREVSLGARNAQGIRKDLPRSAPSLWNVGFLNRYMWDGRAMTLEQQAVLPLTNPDEMNNTPDKVVADLKASSEYMHLFKSAFDTEPTIDNVVLALKAFESSLISLNSRYDRYAYGDTTALNAQEVRGYNVFRGFVARCSQCHIPPLFTDSELSVIGIPNSPGKEMDKGAGAFSSDPNLLGAFKVPTLRNISKTAPYFHSGQFKSLKDAVHFYNDNRGHAAPKGVPLKIHWHVHMTRGPELSTQDEEDIVAFLKTLDDETNTPAIPKIAPSGLAVEPSFNLEK